MATRVAAARCDAAETCSAVVYLEADMPQADTHCVAGGLASVLSVRCPDKETPNEDAAAIVPYGDSGGVLAVADGMGGGRAGELAASIALNSIRESVTAAAAEAAGSAGRGGKRSDGRLRNAILNGIEAANREVQHLGIGAASTLAVVEIQERLIRTYHVGDSLILVTGQRGKLKLQTVSHSPVGFAVEAGLLDREEAMHHHERHIVSNMIGMPDMRIEISSALELAARDTLVVASDGLADNLHVDEIVDCIRKGPLCPTVMKLAGAVRMRMVAPAEGQPSKPDDLTVIAFRPVPLLQDRAVERQALLSAG